MRGLSRNINLSGVRIAAALCVTLAFICIEKPVRANEPVGFSIRAVQSDKQVNKKVSYFDLMLSPGEEHVIEVDIFNTSSAPMRASVTATTAGTNSGGVIDYSSTNVTDDSLFAAFGQLAEVEAALVTIPADSSRRVGVKIKMPEKAFDGVILGGLAIKKIEEETYATETNGTWIQNEYCYLIGVKIRENDTEVAPELRLRHVGPKLSNYHTSIAANIQNYKAAIVKGVKIDASVYSAGSSRPLYTSSSEGFDIAPNSSFDYIIPCSGKLSPGTYRLILTAAHKDRTWKFDEMFTISGMVANDFNSQAVNVPGTNYYKIATFCLVFFIIMLLAWLAAKKLYDRRHKSNEV